MSLVKNVIPISQRWASIGSQWLWRSASAGVWRCCGSSKHWRIDRRIECIACVTTWKWVVGVCARMGLCAVQWLCIWDTLTLTITSILHTLPVALFGQMRQMHGPPAYILTLYTLQCTANVLFMCEQWQLVIIFVERWAWQIIWRSTFIQMARRTRTIPSSAHRQSTDQRSSHIYRTASRRRPRWRGAVHCTVHDRHRLDVHRCWWQRPEFIYW
jgi:hypothetical protein